MGIDNESYGRKWNIFKSITGLAYGRYAYIVKQLDKDNNLLIETDYIEFYIRKQQPPIVNSGNICVI